MDRQADGRARDKGNVDVRLAERNRMGRHPCAIVPNCSVLVAPYHLMCQPHYRMVPAAKQRELWAAYKAWRRSGLLTDYSKLRKAQERAVELVKEKLAAKGLKK